MKLFQRAKDGGKESHVWGLFFVEIKALFSVVLLHFFNGSRDAYHEHAFYSVNWVLRGELIEQTMDGFIRSYKPSFRPIFTPRKMFHRVVSIGDTYVLSFRGPWIARWREYIPAEQKTLTLTHGRKILEAA